MLIGLSSWVITLINLIPARVSLCPVTQCLPNPHIQKVNSFNEVHRRDSTVLEKRKQSCPLGDLDAMEARHEEDVGMARQKARPMSLQKKYSGMDVSQTIPLVLPIRLAAHSQAPLSVELAINWLCARFHSRAFVIELKS
ncbi:hypothetical protein M758_3G249000 [Ceratodon purpureus]|nr:hypothetical protein M758_3G249000 [Ceratodon purpureus]